MTQPPAKATATATARAGDRPTRTEPPVAAPGAQPRPPRIPKFPAPVLAQSPRIAELREAVARGDAGALAAFWAEVDAVGTPLIEPAVGQLHHRIVTFLWRADSAADSPSEVLLLANKLTDPSVMAESRLEALPGTDVWHRAFLLRADWRATYQLAVLPDAPEAPSLPAPTGPPSRWGAAAPHAAADSRNRERFPSSAAGALDLSVVELPDAPPRRRFTRIPSAPAGMLFEHRVASDALGNTRRAWVYAPAAELAASEPTATIVMLDGLDSATHLDTTAMLDALIAERRIAPTTVVFPEALDNATRWRELTCHPPFLDFLEHELLPWAAERWALSPTATSTTIIGHSLGGMTALFAALDRPERFGAALAQSSSLWWPSGTELDAQAGWLAREFALRELPPTPPRLHLQVGLQEWALLARHHHLRDVLEAKGYPTSYLEYHGGHDRICWQAALPDGLEALAAAAVGAAAR